MATGGHESASGKRATDLLRMFEHIAWCCTAAIVGIVATGCATNNATPPATTRPVLNIERLVRTIDDNPTHTHADDTPAVRELIEIGEPAMRPVLPLMLADNALTRQRAWRVIEYVTLKMYGFRDGLGWPDGQNNEQAWVRLYRAMGSYNPEAPEPLRKNSVNLWSQWLSERGR